MNPRFCDVAFPADTIDQLKLLISASEKGENQDLPVYKYLGPFSHFSQSTNFQKVYDYLAPFMEELCKTDDYQSTRPTSVQANSKIPQKKSADQKAQQPDVPYFQQMQKFIKAELNVKSEPIQYCVRHYLLCQILNSLSILIDEQNIAQVDFYYYLQLVLRCFAVSIKIESQIELAQLQFQARCRSVLFLCKIYQKQNSTVSYFMNEVQKSFVNRLNFPELLRKQIYSDTTLSYYSMLSHLLFTMLDQIIKQMDNIYIFYDAKVAFPFKGIVIDSKLKNKDIPTEPAAQVYIDWYKDYNCYHQITLQWSQVIYQLCDAFDQTITSSFVIDIKFPSMSVALLKNSIVLTHKIFNQQNVFYQNKIDYLQEMVNNRKNEGIPNQYNYYAQLFFNEPTFQQTEEYIVNFYSNNSQQFQKQFLMTSQLQLQLISLWSKFQVFVLFHYQIDVPNNFEIEFVANNVQKQFSKQQRYPKSMDTAYSSNYFPQSIINKYFNKVSSVLSCLKETTANINEIVVFLNESLKNLELSLKFINNAPLYRFDQSGKTLTFQSDIQSVFDTISCLLMLYQQGKDNKAPSKGAPIITDKNPFVIDKMYDNQFDLMIPSGLQLNNQTRLIISSHHLLQRCSEFVIEKTTQAMINLLCYLFDKIKIIQEVSKGKNPTDEDISIIITFKTAGFGQYFLFIVFDLLIQTLQTDLKMDNLTKYIDQILKFDIPLLFEPFCFNCPIFMICILEFQQKIIQLVSKHKLNATSKDIQYLLQQSTSILTKICNADINQIAFIKFQELVVQYILDVGSVINYNNYEVFSELVGFSDSILIEEPIEESRTILESSLKFKCLTQSLQHSILEVQDYTKLFNLKQKQPIYPVISVNRYKQQVFKLLIKYLTSNFHYEKAYIEIFNQDNIALVLSEAQLLEQAILVCIQLKDIQQIKYLFENCVLDDKILFRIIFNTIYILYQSKQVLDNSLVIDILQFGYNICKVKMELREQKDVVFDYKLLNFLLSDDQLDQDEVEQLLNHVYSDNQGSSYQSIFNDSNLRMLFVHKLLSMTKLSEKQNTFINNYFSGFIPQEIEAPIFNQQVIKDMETLNIQVIYDFDLFQKNFILRKKIESLNLVLQSKLSFTNQQLLSIYKDIISLVQTNGVDLLTFSYLFNISFVFFDYLQQMQDGCGQMLAKLFSNKLNFTSLNILKFFDSISHNIVASHNVVNDIFLNLQNTAQILLKFNFYQEASNLLNSEIFANQTLKCIFDVYYSKFFEKPQALLLNQYIVFLISKIYIPNQILKALLNFEFQQYEQCYKYISNLIQDLILSSPQLALQSLIQNIFCYDVILESYQLLDIQFLLISLRLLISCSYILNYNVSLCNDVLYSENLNYIGNDVQPLRLAILFYQLINSLNDSNKMTNISIAMFNLNMSSVLVHYGSSSYFLNPLLRSSNIDQLQIQSIPSQELLTQIHDQMLKQCSQLSNQDIFFIIQIFFILPQFSVQQLLNSQINQLTQILYLLSGRRLLVSRLLIQMIDKNQLRPSDAYHLKINTLLVQIQLFYYIQYCPDMFNDAKLTTGIDLPSIVSKWLVENSLSENIDIFNYLNNPIAYAIKSAFVIKDVLLILQQFGCYKAINDIDLKADLSTDIIISLLSSIQLQFQWQNQTICVPDQCKFQIAPKIEPTKDSKVVSLEQNVGIRIYSSVIVDQLVIQLQILTQRFLIQDLMDLNPIDDQQTTSKLFGHLCRSQDQFPLEFNQDQFILYCNQIIDNKCFALLKVLPRNINQMLLLCQTLQDSSGVLLSVQFMVYFIEIFSGTLSPFDQSVILCYQHLLQQYQNVIINNMLSSNVPFSKCNVSQKLLFAYSEQLLVVQQFQFNCPDTITKLFNAQSLYPVELLPASEIQQPEKKKIDPKSNVVDVASQIFKQEFSQPNRENVYKALLKLLQPSYNEILHIYQPYYAKLQSLIQVQQTEVPKDVKKKQVEVVLADPILVVQLSNYVSWGYLIIGHNGIAKGQKVAFDSDTASLISSLNSDQVSLMDSQQESSEELHEQKSQFVQQLNFISQYLPSDMSNLGDVVILVGPLNAYYEHIQLFIPQFKRLVYGFINKQQSAPISATCQDFKNSAILDVFDDFAFAESSGLVTNVQTLLQQIAGFLQPSNQKTPLEITQLVTHSKNALMIGLHQLQNVVSSDCLGMTQESTELSIAVTSQMPFSHERSQRLQATRRPFVNSLNERFILNSLLVTFGVRCHLELSLNLADITKFIQQLTAMLQSTAVVDDKKKNAQPVAQPIEELLKQYRYVVYKFV